MHEVSLVEALFDEVERAIAPHAMAAVRLVRVRIGERAGVETDLFRTAYDACRDERGLGAASLDVVDEPAAWRCRACGEEVAGAAGLDCARCGGRARLVRGGALVLERVELEVPDD